MHVDPSIPGIPEDTARRQLVHCHDEAKSVEGIPRRIQIFRRYHNVQIIVRPCLHTEQRIHTPAAIEPVADTGRFEAVKIPAHHRHSSYR